MNVASKRQILTTFGLLMLGLFIFVRFQHFQRSAGPGAEEQFPPQRVTQAAGSPSSLSMATRREDGLHRDEPEVERMRQTRGYAYVWGNALRNVYATGAVDAQGRRHLDVTELVESFKKHPQLIALEDALASPKARSEYLAAVITAATGLSGNDQPRLAKALEGYYDRDRAQSQLAPAEQQKERARLSAQARKELLQLLPQDAREPFGEIFGAADFLFQSMAVVADRITIKTGGGIANARNGALMSIKPDGRNEITAAEMSFERKHDQSSESRQYDSIGD